MIDQDLLLIEKFLSNELNVQELDLFKERMESDPTFKEHVVAQKNISDVLSNNALKTFEQNLKAIEQDFYKEKETTYSIEELLDMFKEVPDYEDELEMSATRSLENLKVIDPKNGENCIDQVKFVLNNDAPENLTISIENSNEDEVLECVFAKKEKELSVNLESLKPGRYYWKLFGDTIDLYIGSFFIRKDLMPE